MVLVSKLSILKELYCQRLMIIGSILLLLVCSQGKAREDAPTVTPVTVIDLKPLLTAKQLQLTRGENYNLCKEFLANANALPNPAYARGDWPIVLPNSRLSVPGWQTVDPRDYRDILKRYYVNHQNYRMSSMHPLEHPLTDAEMDARIEAEIANGNIALQKAVFNFDQDEYPDTVFRYSAAPQHQNTTSLPGRLWELAVNIGAPEGNTPETDKNPTTMGAANVILFRDHAYVISGGAGLFVVDEGSYDPSSRTVGTGNTYCQTKSIVQ